MSYLRAHIDDKDFAGRFAALQAMKREQSVDVNEAVAAIIDDVRQRGDAALIELTAKYDRQKLSAETLRIGDDEIDAAMQACASETKAALELAAQRIGDFHARQKPEDARFTDAAGVEMGHRWTPVDAAGLYVPGGLANYPSSVLMNAIPARVAGVGRVVMVVPTPDGQINPLVLVAAKLAGVDEIYRIGGAQAIAALAYGTKSIAPVNVIVGPGNAYVAAAKKQVFGQVGIDMIAGPSEILVVADRENDPAWMAADLLSQAEHDEVAQSILICDDNDYADAVAAAVESALATLPRQDIARASWENFGAVLVVNDLHTQAPELVNQLAPEHLELAVAEPDAMADKIRHAGAIFLGRHTPEAIGDYIAGPNHVLPTARAARYASGLSVLDFMKRSSLVKCDADALAAIGPAAVRLAEEEGLDAHGRSIAIRLNMGRDS
ncbi:MAG: Histidinol dehydrogenase [Alphaproteobacteria bacterium]|nr:MAG: Histidinol dehydrogenase [Alphaproteobacteria bacterium]